MNINYKLKMHMGKNIYYGTMKLMINGEIVEGVLESRNMRTSFTGGKIDGNKIEFSGNFRLFLSTINYIAKGELNEDGINLNVSTNKGEFKITGIKE